MVKLNKIYTKTGDDGTTGLVRGPRRPKYDLRVQAYGTVDETNAFLGQARTLTAGMPRVDTVLARIQNDLFDLGSDLSTPPGTPEEEEKSLRITEAQTEWLERQIDHYNAELQPLTSFVLPGGSPLAAALHIVRTVSRRAERLTTELVAEEPGASKEAIRYLNRLSDLMFVLSRYVNNKGDADILWQPGRYSKT